MFHSLMLLSREPERICLQSVKNGLTCRRAQLQTSVNRAERCDRNEPIVVREGDREHVLGVANETASGRAVVEVPQTERTVPRAGQGELAIGAHDHVLHCARDSTKIQKTEQCALTWTK